MAGTRGWLRLSSIAAALGALLAVTACGEGGSGDAGKDGGKTIRIAYQAFPSGDLIVKEKGWLEKALPGYDIKWTKFDSGASINTAFVAGSVDLAAIGSSPVARGLSEPLNIPYQVTWVLDVAGENEALVARNGSKVSSVKDLEGKKVATPFSSTSHYSLLAALDQAGVDASKVQLLDLEPQDILAAWTRGDIDATYVWLPTLEELKYFAKVSEETADQGVQFLGINTRDAQKDPAINFEKDYGVTYPSFFDPIGKLMLRFPKGTVNPKAIPSTVVIDRDGKIAARTLQPLDAEQLHEMIDPIIAEK
ncbi:ABC transporter substrate-binding protein [Streptomyces halstedii]|uniref:ABC transporter substrate-binding protein n=1 Tax=Streptomyces halstedii TaxID=1944 RepID=UPI0033BA1342